MIYVSSIVGSLLFILIRLKIEKQKKDDNPKYSFKIKSYVKKEWDDWFLSLAVGLALVFYQKQMFFGLALWKDYEQKKAALIYSEIDHVIAGLLGLFGSLLIMIFFKFVINKAKKLTE